MRSFPFSPFFCVLIGFMALTVPSVVSAQTSAATSVSAATPSRFMGSYEFAWDNLDAMTQWKDVMARYHVQKETLQNCLQSPRNCQQPEMRLWASIILSIRSLPPMQKLLRVNQLVNALLATQQVSGKTPDIAITATPWQTPLEFLQSQQIPDNAAIAKYFILREAGFSKDMLHITVARDVLRNTRHMILAALIDEKVYILDTRSNAVIQQADLTNYILHYSFNETTRWAYVPIPAAPVSSFSTNSEKSGQEKPQQ